MPKESFFLNRIRSVRYAFRGAWWLIRTEASIKIQISLGILVTVMGFYYNISAIEWIIQIMAVGLILGIEGVNTAVEKIADYIQPEYDIKIGFIKDISAGAVMIVSIAASIIGLIIYLPKIF